MEVAVELYTDTSTLPDHADIGTILPPSEGSDNKKFTLLTVIEPHEYFDVPLYVAYHCKLYVTPHNMG